MEKGSVLCWTCEKNIRGGIFSPCIKTSSGDASACDKHATHIFVIDKEETIKNKMITIKQELLTNPLTS